MDPVSAMAALFADLGTVVTNIWTTITTSLTQIVANPVTLLFVVLVPVVLLSIGIFGRILRIGRY